MLPMMIRVYHEYIKNAHVFPRKKIAQGKHLGFYTEFSTREGEQALLKCGISFVSIEGARKNLQSDISDWNFDGVRQRARRQWNEALSGVQVEGEEKDKTIFYTSLYHTMIDPRCFSDVDGAYPGRMARCIMRIILSIVLFSAAGMYSVASFLYRPLPIPGWWTMK